MSASHRPQSARRRIFALVVLVFAVGFLELATRAFEQVRDLLLDESTPFVDAQNPVPVFETESVDGEEYRVLSEHHPFMEVGLRFPAVKSPDTLRVFLLGGSAAYGWPYDSSNFNIAAQLQRKLRSAYPGRRFEIINAAGGTYGSHRVKFVFDEIVQYDPDLIVLYTGNNEFLERFVFRQPTLPSPWRHVAILRTVHSALSRVENERPHFDVANYSIADQQANRLSYAFGKAAGNRVDPDQLERVVAHFEHNLRAMILGARDRDVGVMLVTVPVNLRDWSPNASRHRESMSAADLAEWRLHYRVGARALEEERYEEAIASLSAAVSADEEHAESRFLLGRALLLDEQFDRAREEFVAALEYDAHPFRAIPELDAVIQDLSHRLSVPLVDVRSALERRVGGEILGRETLVDYVHLRAQSQEVVAHELALALMRDGYVPRIDEKQFVELRGSFPDEFEESDWYPNHVMFRFVSSLYRQYMIMRQYDNIDRVFALFVEVMERIRTEQPHLATVCDRKLKQAQMVQNALVPYRQLLRAERRGTLQEEYTRAEAERIFDRYVKMIRRIEAPEKSLEEMRAIAPALDFEGSSDSEALPLDAPNAAEHAHEAPSRKDGDTEP